MLIRTSKIHKTSKSGFFPLYTGHLKDSENEEKMGREFCRARLASTDSFRQKALRDLIHDINTWSAAIVGLGSTLNSGQAEGTCFAKHRN